MIVVADGRKLKFTKDDITRTLTEPEPVAPDTASVDQLEVAEPVKVRTPREKKQKDPNVE